MNHIQTDILIEATPEKVWSVLLDFDSYPDWNPFVVFISGEQHVGTSLRIHVRPPGQKGMVFHPKLLVLEPQRELRWKGKLFVKGLFDGEHYFRLEDAGEGRTRFIHGELFSGILVGVFAKMLEKTVLGFHAMNEALKERCEKNK